jgi:hypothetical protein
MTGYLVIIAVGALLVLVLTELVAAALPVVIVIATVPPQERADLARLLAACDSSRRLRLWPALRAAVRARREEARRAEAMRAAWRPEPNFPGLYTGRVSTGGFGRDGGAGWSGESRKPSSEEREAPPVRAADPAHGAGRPAGVRLP